MRVCSKLKRLESIPIPPDKTCKILHLKCKTMQTRQVKNQVSAVRTEFNHHYRLVTQFLLRSLKKIHHQAIRWNLVDFTLLKFQH